MNLVHCSNTKGRKKVLEGKEELNESTRPMKKGKLTLIDVKWNKLKRFEREKKTFSEKAKGDESNQRQVPLRKRFNNLIRLQFIINSNTISISRTQHFRINDDIDAIRSMPPFTNFVLDDWNVDSLEGFWAKSWSRIEGAPSCSPSEFPEENFIFLGQTNWRLKFQQKSKFKAFLKYFKIKAHRYAACNEQAVQVAKQPRQNDQLEAWTWNKDEHWFVEHQMCRRAKVQQQS